MKSLHSSIAVVFELTVLYVITFKISSNDRCSPLAVAGRVVTINSQIDCMQADKLPTTHYFCEVGISIDYIVTWVVFGFNFWEYCEEQSCSKFKEHLLLPQQFFSYNAPYSICGWKAIKRDLQGIPHPSAQIFLLLFKQIPLGRVMNTIAFQGVV